MEWTACGAGKGICGGCFRGHIVSLGKLQRPFVIAEQLPYMRLMHNHQSRENRTTLRIVHYIHPPDIYTQRPNDAHF
jgi:hypothetical protein